MLDFLIGCGIGVAIGVFLGMLYMGLARIAGSNDTHINEGKSRD